MYKEKKSKKKRKFPHIYHPGPSCTSCHVVALNFPEILTSSRSDLQENFFKRRNSHNSSVWFLMFLKITMLVYHESIEFEYLNCIFV